MVSLADSSSVDLSVFAQYGVLGVITVLLIWFAKGAHQRERDRADRVDAENKRLNDVLLERVIPALLLATRAVEQSGVLLQSLKREQDRLTGKDGGP